MNKTIIGVDPGIHGAVASIDPSGKVEIFDTPFIVVKKSRGTKNEYNESAMAAILMRYMPADSHVFIEKVGAMPGQGVSSMFSFGCGFGIWKGILAALGFPYTLITPQAWKREIMQGVADKDAARLRACQLFPSVANMLERKKDDGRAESLLIAEFGRRTLK
jgi:crossover junction endodeoxyribonuclease RuvC